MSVVLLAGGTGGAKLARGLLEVAPLTVIANTADDLEIYDAYVSPDPDLVLFWLADRIDERGWGLDGDTFTEMEQLGEPWFRLGDQDLAIGRERKRRLDSGARLTEAIDAVRAELRVRTRVLPMCDEPVRTFIDGTPFQEWMIQGGGKEGDQPIDSIEVRGAERATLTPEVTEALAGARAIVIGPSNPAISIGPILAVPGMREALRRSPAPVVAVSPFVRGSALKGPTVACLRAIGVVPTAAGVAELYHDVIDGFVADEPVAAVPNLVTDVWLGDTADRERVARETLTFADGLA